MSNEQVRDDGGPAFPVIHSETLDRGNGRQEVTFHTREGMTLLDWFAGQALVGILGSRHGFLVDVGTDNAPGRAYEIAEKMVAEKRRREGAGR